VYCVADSVSDCMNSLMLKILYHMHPFVLYETTVVVRSDWSSAEFLHWKQTGTKQSLQAPSIKIISSKKNVTKELLDMTLFSICLFSVCQIVLSQISRIRTSV